MSEKVNKKIPMFIAVDAVEWYSKECDVLTDLSIQTRWNLKKNMRELGNIASQFQEFRQSLENELRDKWMNDDVSVETEIDNGDGNKVPGRKIKDEFIEEYKLDFDDINTKINNLLNEEEEVSLYLIDVDNEVEHMKSNANISNKALDVLSLFDSNQP